MSTMIPKEEQLDASEGGRADNLPESKDTGLTERSSAPGSKTNTPKDPSDSGNPGAQSSAAKDSGGGTSFASRAASRVTSRATALAKGLQAMSGRKKAAIGAGGAVGLIGLLVGAYIAFLPLK